VARRKKQKRLLKQIVVIGGVLMSVQIALLVYFSQSGPERSISDEINEQVSAIKGISPDRRERMKVQLAIDDFRSKHGRLPKSLSELTPVYFKAIPKDPATKKPFAYSVQGRKYTLGEAASAVTATILTSSEGGPPSAEEQEILLASLDATAETDPFLYDPTGKRDPFEPVDFSKGLGEQDCKNFPLTCFDLGQLRYSTYLQFGAEPRGMVEDTTGVGHPVRVGTKIGRNLGEIAEILPDKITVIEKLVDVAGQVSTRVVPLPLTAKVEQDRSARRSGSASNSNVRRR
jgi:type IV pilus assembly protein PilP